MKVSIQGGDANLLCQIPALREGFISLGHEHVENAAHPDTSFVFVGNPPYIEALELAGKKKLILNVLDTCPHCLEHEGIIESLKRDLVRADRVTTISETVAQELAQKVGVKAHVIYYPMKPVERIAERKYPQFRAMIVGRVADANKRAGAAVAALVRAGFKESEIAVVGPEYLGYGTRMGIVKDSVLNDLYNSVDYVMMLSKNEGIGLPAIEGAICGAIPIVAPDLSTFDEFWVQSPLGLAYQTLSSPDKIASLIRSIEDAPQWKSQLKDDFAQYGHQFFRPKFDRVEVAKRILSVYQSI